MRRKLLALLLTLCMAMTAVPAALAADFPDVAQDAWYKENVDYVVEKGMMKGVDGSFVPGGTVTRATVIQVLYNLAGSPDVPENMFADAEGRWYADVAAWAGETGLVDAGKPFRGGEDATRAEIADMLYRYAKFAHLPAGADGGQADAPDSASIPADAREGVAWCVKMGVLAGDPDGNLNPGGLATRAQLAKMFQVFSGLEVVSLKDYLEENQDQFFLTGKTEYVISGRMVSQETRIHNELEDVDYTVADDDESVILTGTVGEQWVTKVSKVISTYTKPDGSPLTAEDFTASKDTGVELKTKAQPDTNYACYVPAGVAVQVDTAWGDVLYANRTGVPHGAGDYLVCALTEDGQPNFEDVWIVNGAIFGSTYDTANGPVVGTITEVEKYGHTVLDVTIEDFLARGFALGDTVNVTFDNGYTLRSIPFFDGYYVEHGEPMVRAYPGHTNIAVCINYGKLFETAGVNVGNTAAITLAQAGGEKDTQTLNSLVYTNSREDYESDEVFANFRAVTVGDIGSLYRSASPVNNENGRAAFSNDLMEAAGVAAVLNLGDTDEEIEAFIAGEDFASGYYKDLYEAGKVVALGMPVDYTSDSFAETLAGGLARLSALEGPYLVHCTEGKDRAGFTSALLECLMGATEEEVVADYMVSYANYYGVTKESDSEKYELIVSNNIANMLRTIAGLEKGASLEGADLQAGAETYLTSHGMTSEQVAALRANLAK